MEQEYGQEQIEKVKEKIIDTTLLVGSALGLISYIISLSQIANNGFDYIYITDLIVITCFISLAFIKNKKILKLKYIAILIGLFMLVITDAIKLGLYSDNKTLLILIPFYSLLVFSFRRTVFIYIVSLVTFAIIGFLHINNHLIPSSNILERTNDPSVWAINILIITIIAFIVVIITQQFVKAYTAMVTNLKHKTKTISEQRSYYREIFNSSTDAIFIHDLSGNIIDFNEVMLNMYGYNHEEATSLSLKDIISGITPYTVGEAAVYLKLAAQGIDQKFDWQAKRKNNSLIWVEVILKCVDLGNDKRIISVVRDINEKKGTELLLEEYRTNLEKTVRSRTQELENSNIALSNTNQELTSTLNKLRETQGQLIQSEKMASLGTMASGVAHEINNPLNFILGGSTRIELYIYDHLQKYAKDLDPMIEDIKNGVNKAANIVSSLGHFSRQTEELNECCDIHPIIKNCLIITKNLWEHHFEIAEDYCIEELKIIGNAGKLHQVFVNILTNAFQAMGSSGQLKIKTFINESGLNIQFKDNGIGIKEELIHKITDPFFTTKDPGEGTGLGMSISYNIMKEHGGTILYESEVNKGTTVIIQIPFGRKNT